MDKNKKRMFIDIVYELDRREDFIHYTEAGRDKRIREKYTLPLEITDNTMINEIKKALKSMTPIYTEYFNDCTDDYCIVTVCLRNDKYDIKNFIQSLKNTKTLEYIYNNTPLKNYCKKRKNKTTNTEYQIAIITDCKYKKTLRPCWLI